MMAVVPNTPLRDPLPVVRRTVRELLTASPAYHELSPEKRREMAGLMVQVCHAAATLLAEEMDSDDQVRSAQDELVAESQSFPNAARTPLATAQNADNQFQPGAVGQVAEATRNILNAVSFPRFVTELINGVFKAMIDSTVQQMHSFVELLNNVSASLEGFSDTNVGSERARQWLVETFPGSYEITGEEPASRPRRGEDDWGDDEEEESDRRVQLRAGAQPPTEAALRTVLGIGEQDTVPTGDPERILVPLVRRQLAAQRQQMLASMVLMGMQRIVIDSGRIHASMRFHIDATSAVQQDRGSMFDFRNTASAAGRFGAGPWGVSAAMTNTIGYASTEQTQRTDELSTEVDVNSSVEIIFHTDYVPLNRITTEAQADRIRNNSLNPAEEERAAIQAREARQQARATRSGERRDLIQERLRSAPTPQAPELPDVPGAAPRQPAPARSTPTRTTPGSGARTGSPATPNPAATRQPAAGGTPARPPASGGGATNPATPRQPAPGGGTPARTAAPGRANGAATPNPAPAQ